MKAVSEIYKIPFKYNIIPREDGNPLMKYNMLTAEWHDYKGTNRGFFYEYDSREGLSKELLIREAAMVIDSIHRDLNLIGWMKARLKPRNRKGLRIKGT